MSNVTLHRLKSNASPQCEMHAQELGTKIKTYQARDYAREEHYGDEKRFPGSKSDGTHIKFGGLDITLGQKVFHGLHQVSAPDWHRTDTLHAVYLGLFKQIMGWIEALLKKQGGLQAWDNVWKPLPPYSEFLVPRKAYHEVVQLQGKEMSNLGYSILGVLAVALRQPQSPPVTAFKHALGWVRALLDFGMMAQY